MSRLSIVILVCAAALLAVRGMQSCAVGAASSKAEDRVKQARVLREEKLRKLCTEKGLTYPPQELFIRAMKREQVVEVWAGGEKQRSLELLATYPLTAFSGTLGPKRREGDYQIPEGVYHINRFNPRSSFHLSLGLNYPNASDRKFADPQKPGSDIFIHGRTASVGCLAIGDEAIEELYILAKDVADRIDGQIPVHIFPARMNDPEWKPSEMEQAQADPALLAFWEDLRPIYSRFEDTKRVPEVKVDEQGGYRLLEAQQ